MCGIAGGMGPGARDAVPGMTRCIAHRGPDDQGVWTDDAHGVALGHRRLSIIDPSPAGHQPMASADGRLHVVYNGEVYNFAELRAELRALGHAFRTRTDTEVILAAWAQWGPASLRRLRGMFAFAVWDARAGELFLARDRFGIKPLYHATAGGTFLFASEVRALLASSLVPRVADRQALWEYLTHGAVPQPRSIVQGVTALLPGHWMRVRGADVHVERWWDVEEETRALRGELAGIRYEEAVEGVRARLDEATRLHLIADVPVGAFLSGGIDSTLVVGLMSRLSGHPIRTFAVGFDASHAALSELKWARLAAERFGAVHTEVIVTAADAARAFERVVQSLDQPSLDGTNTFLVSEAARRDVAVSLSGLGGDELFAGYPHFDRLRRAAERAPAGIPAMRTLADAAGRVLPGRWRTPLQSLVAPPAERIAQLRRLMTDAQRVAATTESFRRGTGGSAVERAAARMRAGLDPVAQVSYAELTGYLRDTLLRDADAMSMAHALEVRPVLLDHGLAEYAFALPSRFKLHGGRAKRVLVDAAADVLPREIVERPKMGFELPLVDWLRTSLRPRADALFEGPTARAIFSPAFLAGVRAELDGARSRDNRLWAYAVLLATMEHLGLELGDR